MKKYNLKHWHNNMWWSAGERTEEQIQALFEVADWYTKEKDGYYIRVSKLFDKEPNWYAEEL